MSEENTEIGKKLYAQGDAETRAWFERQWSIWPERADELLTTNISLHYGGVLQYRVEHGRDPVMSKQFWDHALRLDRYRYPEKSNGDV